MVCWFRSRSKAAEGVAGAESGEPVGEAVVVGVDGQDGFAQQGGEGALVLGDPGLDVVEAVVALGDEEEEPDGEDLARGERAFPVQRGGEVAVQGGTVVAMRILSHKAKRQWTLRHPLVAIASQTRGNLRRQTDEHL